MMSLTRLLRYLSNGEIVDQIANTPVVRRGAQLTHYVYQQGMNKLNNVSKPTQEAGSKSSTLSSFGRTFARNLQKEIEKEMKK